MGKRYGGEYANTLMLKIKNPFWKDVLKHYKKLCNKCKPSTAEEFISENMHYNIKSIREGQIVNNRDCK